MRKRKAYVIPTWLREMVVKKRFTIKYKIPERYRYAVVKNGRIRFFK
ncbi:hypothetical protein M1439_00580 [Candidatus Marsarchaeota archaeon]|nr:hypothetical protein [Candidatus Marsarchaeota archaeon]MCL5099892.1 hypothetical protein [Candidatus Marsarchaeota archaeon]